jgi:hypothetical protein
MIQVTAYSARAPNRNFPDSHSNASSFKILPNIFLFPRKLKIKRSNTYRTAFILFCQKII